MASKPVVYHTDAYDRTSVGQVEVVRSPANRNAQPDRTRHYRAACLFGCAAHRFSADQWVWYNRFGKPCTERGRLLQGRGKTLGTIDLYVASRLQQRRIELGISQRQLAATLGLTFQQIHKYEQGKSRISAGRLYELGKVLGVPITFFIEGLVDALPPAAPLPTGDPTDELGRREAIELFTAYRAISDPVLRRSLRELARALGPEPNISTAKPSASQSRRASRRART